MDLWFGSAGVSAFYHDDLRSELVGVSDFQIPTHLTHPSAPTPRYPWPGTLWGGNPHVLWAAFQEELLLGDSGLHGDVIFFLLF